MQKHPCKDGLGQVHWSVVLLLCVYTQRDKMSPTEKTRKVNWNGRTWHLFKPLKYLAFYKSNRYLIKARGNWLLERWMFNCRVVYLGIFISFPHWGKKLFEDKLGISCSEMIYVPIWGKAAPLLLPPHCLFSVGTCVTYSVPHILVIREDWPHMKMGVGIKILIELLAPQIHHFRAALSLGWVLIEQRRKNKLCLLSEGEWTVAK